MSETSLQVAIVADDLTGAMDAAAPFARRGLSTRVVCVPHALDQALASPLDVISVNTGTRHADPAEAAAVTAACVAKLAPLEPAILFKKIDSTLRGNVAAETVAALGAGRCRQAVVTPALPAQGRTVSGGRVFIHGVPLAETAIGRDKRSPPPLEPLPALFADIDTDLEVVSLAIGEAPPEAAGRRILVADAATTGDLERIAMVPDRAIFVGAGGLAEVVAGQHWGPVKPLPDFTVEPGLIVFAVGSRTPESAAQVARIFATDDACTVFNTDDGGLETEEALAWLDVRPQSSDTLVLRVTQFSSVIDGDAERVARNLAESTVRLVRRRLVSVLAMTGGDTAGAILSGLERMAIDVVGEVLPGIVFGRIDYGARTLWVLAKAGGFGDDNLFVDIKRFFAERTENKERYKVTT